MTRYMVLATEPDGYQWLVDYVVAASADIAIKFFYDCYPALNSRKLIAMVA